MLCREYEEQTRTWHDEWVDAWVERVQMGLAVGDRGSSSMKGAAADMKSIEQVVEDLAGQIKWQVYKGWPRQQAEEAGVHIAITSCLNAPLAAAVRDRSDPSAAVRARSGRSLRGEHASRVRRSPLARAGQADDGGRAAPLQEPDRRTRPGDSGSGMGGADAAGGERRPQALSPMALCKATKRPQGQALSFPRTGLTSWHDGGR